MATVVLSYLQVGPLLAAWQAGDATVSTSPDLGRSQVEVHLAEAGVHFPTGELLRWEDARRIAASQTKCFTLEDGTARDIYRFSEETGWARSLMPTRGAPTMLVAGLPMHRIKDTDPYADTLRKVATLAPLLGRVLDTATGLGYTAIEAARTAEEVVTIELDPASLEIARANPWSQPLFEYANIVQHIGDAADLIHAFPDHSFSRVLHDPPMQPLAGDLYGAAFYCELWRVLGHGGRLFHYIGDPKSASGARTTAGVLRRLGEAGFRRVVRRPEAFGVVAYR